MIIIAMQDLTTEGMVSIYSKLGHKAQAYHQLDLKGIEDNAIIILDLSATGRFQKLVSAKEFSEHLIKAGMSEKIDSIYFYMSDISVEKSLFSFTDQVRKYFKKNYHREITLFYPTDIQCQYTLLVPPTVTKSKWEVYGINKSDLVSKTAEVNFKSLYQCSGKKLLWDGYEINEWLSRPDHVCRDKVLNENASVSLGP